MLVTIYTDASFKDGNAGGGAYIRSDAGLTKWGQSFKADNPQEAEAYCMLAAVQFAHRNIPRIKTILIVSDSKHCVEYLWPFKHTKLKHQPTKTHLETLIAYAKKNKFNLRTRWIKGHQKTKTTQVWVNNHVDKIAKEHNEATINK